MSGATNSYSNQPPGLRAVLAQDQSRKTEPVSDKTAPPPRADGDSRASSEPHAGAPEPAASKATAAPAPKASFAEFVILMAFMMSLVAMSVDTMLPALGLLGSDLQIANENTTQFVVTVLFLGMTAGQIFYGPLSDSIGRKNALYIGLTLYIIGALIAWVAPTFGVLLFGRLVQGLGAASSRIVTLAMVRDRFEGRDMARVMSLVMGCFILVPAIAPTIGQGVLYVADWRSIFLMLAVMGGLAMALLSLRLRETLPQEKRRAFSFSAIGRGLKEVVSNRITLGYTITAGLIFGALLAYISSSQQVFHDLYDAGSAFALYFAMVALCIGAASFLNSTLVRRFGMRRITRSGLGGMILLSGTLLGLSLFMNGVPPLALFLGWAMLTFFCIGMMFGNINAMAMEPMGHIAGLAAAVIGTLSGAISLALAMVIGLLYNDTLIPLISGMFVLSCLSAVIMAWAEKDPAGRVVQQASSE